MQFLFDFGVKYDLDIFCSDLTLKKREVCVSYSELSWNWVWWAEEEHSGASADFRLCLRCTVCDGGQCRCPEGRVDAPLHDVSPHETGLPTVPQFQYLTLLCKKKKKKKKANLTLSNGFVHDLQLSKCEQIYADSQSFEWVHLEYMIQIKSNRCK